MIYTVKFENVQLSKGRLMDVEVDLSNDNELKGFEYLVIDKDHEIIHKRVLSEMELASPFLKYWYKQAIQLKEEQGCAFFNNLIYKDMGGSL